MNDPNISNENVQTGTVPNAVPAQEPTFVPRYDTVTGRPLDPNEPPAEPFVPRFDTVTGQPLNPPVQTWAPPVKRRPSLCSERKDGVLALLLAVLGVLLMDSLLTTGLGIGVSICLTLLLVVTVCYLWKRRRAVTAYAAFCGIAVLALSLSLVFSDDDYLKFYALLGCMALSTLLLLELMKQRKRQPGTIYSVADLSSMMFVRSFGRIDSGTYALFHAKKEDGSVRKRRLGGVVAGIACAIPVLLVVVPLLVSSDAAFEGLVSSFHLEDQGLHFCALLLGLFLALVLFSQLFHLPYADEAQVQKKPMQGWLDPIPVVSFLVVLSIVYVLYLVSQGAYFLDAFKGLLPEGFSFAEYARRGFFEVWWLCILNLLLVFFSLFLSKKKSGKAPFAVRLLALFICLFSLFLIATSVSKLVLYIQNYGMTRLRILTNAAMLGLGVVFLAVMLRLFVPKIPYMKITVVTATVILLALSFANVDRIVASYNVRAYQNGWLDSIDVETVSELSDAAVPYLLELLDDPNPEVVREARSSLQERSLWLGVVEHGEDRADVHLSERGYDLRGFNIVDAQARALLHENYARIFPTGKFTSR